MKYPTIRIKVFAAMVFSKVKSEQEIIHEYMESNLLELSKSDIELVTL